MIKKKKKFFPRNRIWGRPMPNIGPSQVEKILISIFIFVVMIKVSSIPLPYLLHVYFFAVSVITAAFLLIDPMALFRDTIYKECNVPATLENGNEQEIKIPLHYRLYI